MFTMIVVMALVTTGMVGFVLPAAEPERLAPFEPAAPARAVPSRNVA
jgi:hypothetical protein